MAATPEVHYEEVDLTKRPKSIEMYQNSSYLTVGGKRERYNHCYIENRNVRQREETTPPRRPSCRCFKIVKIVDIMWRISMTILVLAALCLSIWLFTAFSGKAQSSQECRCDVATGESSGEKSTTEYSTPTSSPANTTPPTSFTDHMTTPITTNTQPTTTAKVVEGPVTLSNVSLYMDCTTSIERSCNILTSSVQCNTGFGLTYQRPGEFIMDISCVRVAGSGLDQNGLSYTLSIDETHNEVQCYCYLVDIINSGGAIGTRRQETCGLRVTRCRTFSNITAGATLHAQP